MTRRVLGRSGIAVSPMGLGCWAIGGEWTLGGVQAGWTGTDDNESIRAIHAAISHGVTFFDTAANYGAGHSERLLGKALAGCRQDVVVATKFGYRVDDATRTVVAHATDDAASDVARYLPDELEASLRRLGTDYLDVYQLHVWGLSIERAIEARDVLDRLVAQGKIRTYGWSTDRTDAIQAFSTSPSCGVVQQQLSVMDGNEALLQYCEASNLASICRGPLGMGSLTGKFAPGTGFPDGDVRAHADWHPAFRDGKASAAWLAKLASIRDILTSGGRSLAQGALAGIWSRSPVTIPIPGFKSVKQVEENCKAMALGPLTPAQHAEIRAILGSLVVD